MLGLDGSDDLPFIFLQRFFFGDVLGGIFGGHIRPCISHVCCYLVDMLDLIIISFHECQFDLFACLVHHFHTRTCCSAKFPLQIGSVFSIPPSPQTFRFFFWVGYRAWVAVVSLHWRPAYWPSAMVSTTERPWTTKESGRNLWRLGRAPGASRICGR